MAADQPTSQPRLGIGVISAGKVGAVLGAALRAAGHAITGVHAVSDASQERAENLLPEVPLLSPEEICRRSELVLFAVPDDELAPLISGLATGGHFVPGQLLVHTAGKMGAEVFAPATGCLGLAIHPMMTFTGMSLDLERLRDCPFAVTAPATILPIAQALVVEMGGEPVIISQADRPRYHLSLAHGSNHLVTIVAEACEELARCGVNDAALTLTPLLRASLENALASGAQALTGPVSRADIGTLSTHLAALADAGTAADLRLAYPVLAEATALRALAAGKVTETQAARVLDALRSAATETQSTPDAVAATRPSMSGAAGESASTPAEAANAAATSPVVVHTIEDFQHQLASRCQPGARLGFVPTMGALHSGHQELFAAARKQNDVVAISIFANPLQFDREEDFRNYPRTLEADVERAAESGVDIVFAPEVETLYPVYPPRISVDPGPLGSVLEGALRPGHFAGVATIVNKLFNLIAAAISGQFRAYFGEKDAQQLALIRAMVADFHHPVQIESVPIVRDEHGVALSSRNARLSPEELVQARALNQALELLAGQAQRAEPLDVAAARKLIEDAIDHAPGDDVVDDLVIVDDETFRPLSPAELADPSKWPPRMRALLAAFVGPVRLIDNRLVKGTTHGE